MAERAHTAVMHKTKNAPTGWCARVDGEHGSVLWIDGGQVKLRVMQDEGPMHSIVIPVLSLAEVIDMLGAMHEHLTAFGTFSETNEFLHLEEETP